MMSLKKKIEANELRLNKMMKILENSAFEDEGFGPDISESDNSVTDEKLDEMGSEIVKGENTESGEGDKEHKTTDIKEIRHAESSATLQPPQELLQPPHSSKSSRKSSRFHKKPHPKPSSK